MRIAELERATPRVKNEGTSRNAVLKICLEKTDWDGLLLWASQNRNPFRPLFSLLFDHDELIRWRTIVGIGKVSARLAAVDIEKVRVKIRHLFWQMSDESGGLIWNAPEAITEILVNVPELIEEYAGILACFTVEEPFERGAHYAIARLSRVNSSVFFDGRVALELKTSLKSDDPYIRAYGLSALFVLDEPFAREKAKQAMEDQSEVSLYDFSDHRMKLTSVGKIARGLLSAGAEKQY